jgi:hypothetical protein
MTTDPSVVDEQGIDWSLCTWEGARLAQLQAYRELSLAEKLAAVEQMCDVIRALHAARVRRGLPVDDTSPAHACCGRPDPGDR